MDIPGGSIMPDLTQGYRGGGKGNLRILEAILKQAPLNVNLPGHWLPQKLFTLNFMPYAKRHWRYDGSACNCEDLSSALTAIWDYIKTTKRSPREGALPRAEKVRCLVKKGLITKPTSVFAGPAKGNVRLQPSGSTDGRCLFPVHWICKIGNRYFDPTYDRMTQNPQDIVQRTITKRSPGLWISTDGASLYVRDAQNPAPGFSDSWREMNAGGWITAADWKEKTARSLHTRSGDLQRLDAALESFESQGANALEPLRTSFSQWATRNPKEASSRNVDNCVSGLGAFLGVAIDLRA
jgi:hypothetical protein